MPPHDTSARDVAGILDRLIDQLGDAAGDADDAGSFAVAYRVSFLQSKARHLRELGRLDAFDEAVMDAQAFGFWPDGPTSRESAAAAERIALLHGARAPRAN